MCVRLVLGCILAFMLFCSTAGTLMLYAFYAYAFLLGCFLLGCERSGHTTACSPFKMSSKTVCELGQLDCRSLRIPKPLGMPDCHCFTACQIVFKSIITHLTTKT